MAAKHADGKSPKRTWAVPDIVSRPPFQLRSLPIRYRWEVTRRHPYYQNFWLIARAHHRREPIDHAVDELFGQVVVLIFEAIGVTGEPPDPGTEFAELGEADLQSGWLSGAVHPITFVHRQLNDCLSAKRNAGVRRPSTP